MKIETNRPMRNAALAIAICVAPLFFPAGAMANGALKLTDASFMQLDDELRMASGHPNEMWRYHGLKSYVSGRYGTAIEQFERASGYADKLSQHYLSLMYWNGIGIRADRVQAYIWSDLAAERGGVRLLAIRETMWEQLDAAQRAEVDVRGGAFHERYADAAAKPRAEIALRRFARQMTGSRVGYNDGFLGITYGGPIHGSFDGGGGLAGASAMANGGSNSREMYAEARTRAAAYWREQDRVLHMLRVRVEVGPIQEEPGSM